MTLDNQKSNETYHAIGFVPSQNFLEPIYFPTFERLVDDSRIPVY